MNKQNFDDDSEYAFKALKLLEDKSSPTQRELSLSLNLSLGKINFVIRSLVAKGWIKVERFKNSKNKSAYLYYLTPEGFEKKTVLAKNFLIRKTSEYNSLKIEIEELKLEINRNN